MTRDLLLRSFRRCMTALTQHLEEAASALAGLLQGESAGHLAPLGEMRRHGPPVVRDFRRREAGRWRAR